MPDFLVAEFDQRVKKVVHADLFRHARVDDVGCGLDRGREAIVSVGTAWLCREQDHVLFAQDSAERLEQLDPVSQAGPFQTEALEILIAWGEKRTEAMELVELACRKHPDINSAEALVPLVYRLKQGVEV